LVFLPIGWTMTPYSCPPSVMKRGSLEVPLLGIDSVSSIKASTRDAKEIVQERKKEKYVM
jgi:hypothetical protein